MASAAIELEEGTDELAARIEAALLLPLEDHEVADRIAQPPRERRSIHSLVGLDVDGLDPERLREREEGERDARPGGDEHIWTLAAQDPPRQPEVAEQVGDVSLGRMVRPVEPLAGEQGSRVGLVEGHPA